MVSILTRPRDVIWTKNTAKYTFYMSYSLVNKLEIEFINADNSASIVKVQYPYDPTAASITVYINDILDAYCREAITPQNTATQGNELVILPATIFKFYIAFREIGPGLNNPKMYDGSYPWSMKVHSLLKGGIGEMVQDEEALINLAGSSNSIFLPSNGRFLTWVPQRRLMRPTEKGWLMYYSDTQIAPQKVVYTVFYVDGTSASTSYNLVDPGTGSYANKLWWIPTGLVQAGVPGGSLQIDYYVIGIALQSGGASFVTYRIDVEQRPSYTPFMLYYRNSLGGMDNIALDGERDMTVSVEKKELHQSPAMNPSKNTGANPHYDSSLRPKWKANTGWISRAHAMALTDLANTSSAYVLHNLKWIPVRVMSDSVKILDTRGGLYNVEIELETSGSFNVLPKQLGSIA